MPKMTKPKSTPGERVIRDLARQLVSKLTRLRNKASLVAGDGKAGRNLTALRNTAAEVDELLYLIRLRRCRVCACTDDNACEDPKTGDACQWVAKDLCSACQSEVR